MKISRILSTAAATTLIATGLISSAFADDKPSLAFASEVDSCIAAVNANLNLQDANRVRHVVTPQQRPGHAYAFIIETWVFTDKNEIRYDAYCVSRGDEAPSSFRISQKTS